MQGVPSRWPASTEHFGTTDRGSCISRHPVCHSGTGASTVGRAKVVGHFHLVLGNEERDFLRVLGGLEFDARAFGGQPGKRSYVVPKPVSDLYRAVLDLRRKVWRARSNATTASSPALPKAWLAASMAT